MPDADGPYVGPRPFDRSERERFFGRDHEAQALASLVVAHRVVLLYAASGAGKTSLLNAGAIPLLEDDDGFEVLPTVRLQGLAGPDGDGNPYLRNLLANLARAVADDSDHATLAGFLASRPHATPDDDLPAPRLLVIDQFEELFTLYPEHWPQRGDVFDALAEALEQDPLLRVVLSIREDFIAQLDPYASQLRVRTRMRLEPLRRPAALAAIAQPLAGEARTFAPGVAEQLVDDLLKVRVHTVREESAEVPGELVEPVQLQVVCRTLWSTLPPGVQEIGEADLARIGSVSDVLSTYYSEAVRAAASAGGIAEHDLRERLEAAFVTAVGTRGTVVGAGERIAGMPAAAINELEARHLVRAEWRAGARWFELAHDSLIRPIVSSNAVLREQRRRRREKRLTRAVAGLVAVAGILVAFLVFGRDEEPAGQAAKAPKVGVVEARAPLAGLRLARDLSASAAPVAISTTASGRGLLVAAADGRVRAWDINVGREIDTLDYGDPGLASIDVDPDGGAIVAAGASGLKRWFFDGLGTQTPETIDFAEDDQGSDDPVAGTAAAFAPFGHDLVIVRDGQARLNQQVAGEADESLFTQPVTRVAYGPRGTLVLGIAEDGTVRLRDVTPPDADGAISPVLEGLGRERLLRAPGRIVSAGFSADDAQVVTASSDGAARVWRTRDAKLLRTVRSGRAALSDARLNADESLIATADSNGMLRVWTAGGQRVAVVRASLRPLTALAWGAGGQLLVTADADGRVRVWTNVAPSRPNSARVCSAAQYLLPATRAADFGARGSDRRSYIGSIGCPARAGEEVRAPEAGTITTGCGPRSGAHVALQSRGGRCWVFLGAEPHGSATSVDAGAAIGRMSRSVDTLRIELWEDTRRGHRVGNLWNPMLFLDVRASNAPPYPGDDASTTAIAQWMGATAKDAGLPPELPVMAGLVESGLRNLNFGDADSIGLFQMPLSRWNRGEYAGYPDRPDLQLKWFIDRAKAVRADLAESGRDPIDKPQRWGDWAYRIEEPHPQYRGRFQTRLEQAQRLLSGAVAPTLDEPGPAAAVAVPAAPAAAAPEQRP